MVELWPALSRFCSQLGAISTALRSLCSQHYGVPPPLSLAGSHRSCEPMAQQKSSFGLSLTQATSWDLWGSPRKLLWKNRFSVELQCFALDCGRRGLVTVQELELKTSFCGTQRASPGLDISCRAGSPPLGAAGKLRALRVGVPCSLVSWNA